MSSSCRPRQKKFRHEVAAYFSHPICFSVSLFTEGTTKHSSRPSGVFPTTWNATLFPYLQRTRTSPLLLIRRVTTARSTPQYNENTGTCPSFRRFIQCDGFMTGFRQALVISLFSSLRSVSSGQTLITLNDPAAAEASSPFSSGFFEGLDWGAIQLNE